MPKKLNLFFSKQFTALSVLMTLKGSKFHGVEKKLRTTEWDIFCSQKCIWYGGTWPLQPHDKNR